MNSAAISIRRLKHPFGDAKVGLDIHLLEIQKGERVLIRGRSGSGKSTLIQLMAGLIPVSQGTVQILGHDLAELDTTAREKLRRENLGIIFQSYHTIDFLSCQENLALVADGPRDPEKIAGALRAVHLADKTHQICGSMSPGERQRVAVARTLLQRAPIVLADEPTAHLDRLNAQDVFEQLVRTNTGTLVAVSHDHGIESLFDRVIEIEKFVGEVRGRN